MREIVIPAISSTDIVAQIPGERIIQNGVVNKVQCIVIDKTGLLRAVTKSGIVPVSLDRCRLPPISHQSQIDSLLPHFFFPLLERGKSYQLRVNVKGKGGGNAEGTLANEGKEIDQSICRLLGWEYLQYTTGNPDKLKCIIAKQKKAGISLDYGIIEGSLSLNGKPSITVKVNPLSHAIGTAHDPEMVRILLEEGADPNAHVNGHPYSAPIFIALQLQKPKAKEIIAHLIKHKVNLNVIGYQKKTPLQYAIMNEDIEMVVLFLKNGANPKEKKASALAQKCKNPKILEILNIAKTKGPAAIEYVKEEPLEKPTASQAPLPPQMAQEATIESSYRQSLRRQKPAIARINPQTDSTLPKSASGHIQATTGSKLESTYRPFKSVEASTSAPHKTQVPTERSYEAFRNRQIPNNVGTSQASHNAQETNYVTRQTDRPINCYAMLHEACEKKNLQEARKWLCHRDLNSMDAALILPKIYTNKWTKEANSLILRFGDDLSVALKRVYYSDKRAIDSCLPYIFSAAEKEGYLHIIEWTLDCGYTATYWDLYDFVKKENAPLISLFLQRQIGTKNFHLKEGSDLALLAAKQGNKAIFAALIRAGANLEINGGKLFQAAAEHGWDDVIFYLYRSNIKISYEYALKALFEYADRSGILPNEASIVYLLKSGDRIYSVPTSLKQKFAMQLENAIWHENSPFRKEILNPVISRCLYLPDPIMEKVEKANVKLELLQTVICALKKSNLIYSLLENNSEAVKLRDDVSSSIRTSLKRLLKLKQFLDVDNLSLNSSELTNELQNALEVLRANLSIEHNKEMHQQELVTVAKERARAEIELREKELELQEKMRKDKLIEQENLREQKEREEQLAYAKMEQARNQHEESEASKRQQAEEQAWNQRMTKIGIENAIWRANHGL